MHKKTNRATAVTVEESEEDNMNKEELTNVLKNHRHWLKQLTMHTEGSDEE